MNHPPPHPESHTWNLLSRALPHMQDPELIGAVADYLVTGVFDAWSTSRFGTVYFHDRGTPADWWVMSIGCWPALRSANHDPWRSLEDYLSVLRPPSASL